MLAVIEFPSNKDEEEFSEAVSDEIDAMFDHMDERLDEGAEATDVLAAMIVIIKMISQQTGKIHTTH